MPKPVATRDVTSSRYSRHIALAGFGQAGQTALFDARVLVVGAGGLGSPVLAYLAAAGVGAIGLVDDDVVETSNLQRQIVHRDDAVGAAKVSSAAEFVRGLNPDVDVLTHRVRLDAESALEILPDYDLVVDGTDNFAARYLLNDACVLLGLPLVWASISEFSGQLSVVVPGAGPCYRCVFPQPVLDGSVLNCADAGVLGVLPGVIGSLQAAEAIKVLTGIGDALVGRLLIYDALTASTELLSVRRDPRCPVCAPEAPVPQLVDEGAAASGVREVDSHALSTADVVIDVREPAEIAREPFPGAQAHPLSRWDAELPTLVQELQAGPPDIVLVCASGVRSRTAAQRLVQAGIAQDRVSSLAGGLRGLRGLKDKSDG